MFVNIFAIHILIFKNKDRAVPDGLVWVKQCQLSQGIQQFHNQQLDTHKAALLIQFGRSGIKLLLMPAYFTQKLISETFIYSEIIK
jgi:hypothetical protein